MKNHTSIALGFFALIIVGAFVLSSPWARVAGNWGDFETALFTSCSAVCVTGLSVVEVAREFTFAGQVALLVLVQIGCLGLMTCGTFLLVAIGRRLSLSREFSLMNAYGVAEIHGLRSLICWVVGSMVVIEGAGAAALYWRIGEAYPAVFYSVMSFCNAGFGLLPGSLSSFLGDPLTIMILAAETVLGGIGFLVIYNLCTFKFLRRPSGGKGRLSLHASVVLRFTAYLLLIAFAVFLVVEWDGVLKGMPLVRKLYIACYQAVTPRTCGFWVVPTESLQPVTRLFYEALMFIGGAPGSAAAGIKVTTFAVLVYTIRAMCRGETDTVISRRVVPYDIVRESIVIVMAMLFFMVVITGTLMVTETESGIPPDRLFFEVVSAVTTTGLSVGDTTARLSSAGRIALMFAMFFGRLGALTVVMMIGDRESQRHIRFPQDELVVG